MQGKLKVFTMLLNEVMHTIKACSDYGYAANIAGRRIASLILFHRESGSGGEEPIILQTGIKTSALPEKDLAVFCGLSGLLGTSCFCSSDGNVFLIEEEQETKTVMKAWEFLCRCFSDYRDRFFHEKSGLAGTLDLFISEIDRFPQTGERAGRIKSILASGKFDFPPAKMIVYDAQETVEEEIPADVREGSRIEFCFFEKSYPNMKYSSYGSIYHQDNARQKPVIKTGEVMKGSERVRYTDGGKECTRSLDRVYVRDVLAP